LVKNLASSNYVVYTYASIAVERVLFLTNDTGRHIFGKDEIAPFSKDLLEHLFLLIEKDTAPEKIQENEFLMRCVMRVLIVIKDGVLPITDLVLGHLIQITQIISQNPSNPRFYYYHFEAMGALVRYAAASETGKLENALYPPFAAILQNEVQGKGKSILLSDYLIGDRIHPICFSALRCASGSLPAGSSLPVLPSLNRSDTFAVSLGF
jgi:exportin-2 (importin alpha re-exporter)